MVSLKCLSNFWKNFEMRLTNYEINILLTWFEKCIIVTWEYGNQEPKFAITNTKLYVSGVIKSTKTNENILRKIKTGFKRTINHNKYHSEPNIYTQIRYLNQLTDSSFQGANKFFNLSFKNDEHRRSYKQYFLLTIEIKDSMLWLMEKKFFISQ